MVSQSNGRGNLVIDRQIRGIEIKRTSGCPNTPAGKREAKAMEVMLLSFGRPGTERLDLLRDIADGHYSIATVYSHWQRGTLRGLALGPRVHRPLKESWERWIETTGGANQSVRRVTLARLLERNPNASVADLPELVRGLVDRYRDAGKARSGNHYRMMALAFVRDVLGRRHPMRADLADIPPIKHVAKHGRPQTVAEALAVRSQLPEPHASHWWALCLTGMRSKEYFTQQWVDEGQWVRIRGTKTLSAQRLIPRIEAVPLPKTRAEAFRIALRKLAGQPVTAHDARRSYRIWLREAGIARVDRDLMLGHGRHDMEAIYEHREQAQMMATAAAHLAAYITAARQATIRKVG